MKNILFIFAAIVLLQCSAIGPVQAEMNVMPPDQMEATTGNRGICVPNVEDGCYRDDSQEKTTSRLDDRTVIKEMEKDTQTLPETDIPQPEETSDEKVFQPQPEPYESPFDPDTTQSIIDTINQARDNMY